MRRQKLEKKERKEKKMEKRKEKKKKSMIVMPGNPVGSPSNKQQAAKRLKHSSMDLSSAANKMEPQQDEKKRKKNKENNRRPRASVSPVKVCSFFFFFFFMICPAPTANKICRLLASSGAPPAPILRRNSATSTARLSPISLRLT